jgi:hypothetical protein
MPHVLGPVGAPPDPCPPPPADLPVLRAGRQDLHQRLDDALANTTKWGPLFWWEPNRLRTLLAEARDAVLTCPVEGCALCFHLDREETT